MSKRETTLPPHHDRIRFFAVYNDSGETIPPFAVMRITYFGADHIAHVDKPDRNGMTTVIVNGHHPILAGEIGQANGMWPATAAYIQEGGPIQYGEPAGVIANEWFLQKSYPGFSCVSVGDDGTALFERLISPLVYCVEITSLVKVGNFYPAIEVIYEPETDTFAYGDVCWWRDLND